MSSAASPGSPISALQSRCSVSPCSFGINTVGRQGTRKTAPPAHRDDGAGHRCGASLKHFELGTQPSNVHDELSTQNRDQWTGERTRSAVR